MPLETDPTRSLPPGAPTLADYTRALVGRWRLIVAVGVIGLAVTAAGLVVLGTQETARTDLNLNVISTDPFNAQRSAAGLLDGPTEVQIAGSFAVAQSAADALGDVSPAELREHTTAELVSQATVIRISYTAGDVETARQRADALAAAYLEYRGAQAVDRRRAVVDQVDARLDELRDSLTEAEARAAAAEPGSSAANQAASDRQLITIEVDSLLSQRNSLQLVDTSGGSVLSSAESNPVASSPNRPLVLASGLLAGLILGAVAAMAANAFDRRVRTVEDAERFSGTAALALLPGRVAGIPARPADAERYRTVRERLLAGLDGSTGALAIIDDTVGDELDEVAVDLAVAFAQLGRPVRLLVPGVAPEQLATIRAALELRILSRGDDTSVWSPADLPELRIVIAERAGGIADPDPMLTRAMLAEVAAHRDDELVILALPPSAPFATRLSAARTAGRVLLVIALAGTRRAVLARDADGYESLGVEVMGSVLVSARRRLAEALDDAPVEQSEPARVRRTEPPRDASARPGRRGPARRGGAAGDRRAPAAEPSAGLVVAVDEP